MEQSTLSNEWYGAVTHSGNIETQGGGGAHKKANCCIDNGPLSSNQCDGSPTPVGQWGMLPCGNSTHTGLEWKHPSKL